MKQAPIIIVGAGPGGCAAAVQCVRLGVRPLLLDRTGRPGGLLGNAWSVENYPGLEPMNGRELSGRLAAFLDRFGVGIEPADVTAIGGNDGHLVVDSSGGTLEAGAVIAATGTRPVRLPVAGAEALLGDGFWYEVRHLLESGVRPRHVAVIGGGEAALDYSLSLAGAGAAVTLLVRGEEIRAGERLIDLVASNGSISIRHGSEVTGLRRSAAGFR